MYLKIEREKNTLERYLNVFGFRNSRKFLVYYAKKCYVEEHKET
jgi:hypothetical protein